MICSTFFKPHFSICPSTDLFVSEDGSLFKKYHLFLCLLKNMRSGKLCNMMCLTIPSLFSRYDSSSKTVFACLPIFDDLEGGYDATTTRKLLILSRPRYHRTQGSNTPVRRIPPSDYINVQYWQL